MARVAFHLRIRADRIQDYDEAHRAVWPDLLRVIKRAGVTQYSIFRRGQDLFFYLQADDFERTWSEIASHPLDQRWQQKMAALFEPIGEQLAPGERLPMMREVFYLA